MIHYFTHNHDFHSTKRRRAYFAMLNLPLHWIESLSRGIDIQWVNIPVYSVLLGIVVWLIMVFKNAYLANIRVIDRVVVFVLLLGSVALNPCTNPMCLVG